MKLRKLRVGANLSQEDLAEALDALGAEVSDGTISNWETGRHAPNLKEAVALAKFFGVSLDYLAFDELGNDEPSVAYPCPVRPASSQPAEKPVDAGGPIEGTKRPSRKARRHNLA